MRIERFLSDLTIELDLARQSDVDRLEIIKSEFKQRFDLLSELVLDTTSSQILSMYYLQDMQIEDIARQLNLSPKEVISMKYKAIASCKANARWAIMYEIAPYYKISTFAKREYDMYMGKKLATIATNMDINFAKDCNFDCLNLSQKSQTFLTNNKITTIKKLASKSCKDLKSLGATDGIIHEILFIFNPHCRHIAKFMKSK